jgi:DNA-binding transcriptional MerR regulator
MAVIQAFGEEHVERLTGLTKWQLRRWDNAGFFKPRYAYEDRFVPYSRIYSFKDVVGLRTIAVLMKEHKVSLQQLRRVAGELIRRGFDHWADLKLWVVKRQVHFQKPGASDVEGVWDGQLAMLPIIDVIEDVEARVKQLKQRDPSKFGQVERHKFVVRNATVIAGTRIPTATIRRFREAGYSKDQILLQYPTLTMADIDAALAHEDGLAQSA